MDFRWSSSKTSCSSLGSLGGDGPRANAKGALLSSSESFEGVVENDRVTVRVDLAMEGVKAKAPRDAKREAIASEAEVVLQNNSETVSETIAMFKVRNMKKRLSRQRTWRDAGAADSVKPDKADIAGFFWACH